MKYWNKRLKTMREYIPGEQPWNIDDYIKLNTNENPFPPAESVMDTISMTANGNLRRYPDPTAMELRKIFAEQNDLSHENIFIGNGSDEIFSLIFRAFIESSGVAAFSYPSYSLYDILAEANGIKYEKITLEPSFKIDFAKFLDKNYRIVIITNPNNPTGVYTSVSDIENFVKRFSGLVIIDEAYIDFYGGSAISLIKKYDNLIVTRSFSKSYSLAGMRIGVAAAHKDIIDGFLKIKDSYNVNTLSIVAAISALTDKKSFNYNVNQLVNNKEYLEDRLLSMDFEIVPSRANFLFCKHPKINSQLLYEKLKEKKILVRHFKGTIQEDYVRITVGTMMEIKQLCVDLESIIQDI